ncbi:J domain-containing protein [Sphingomonas sp. BK345]|uniref:J domain-containing protein n=1 Tax=Sphingomonas sp. BK345 TaxID=2586980 RepID=UPI00160A9C81|nr:DnaJ domain-containing protein [Sphingomonas sp. BK345]MBB3472127.1 curved DNA-binding protein CbpA [Sphingomonas sp. BK345]
MALSPDYYSVLGVPSTANRDAIHAAWKALLRQYHPDANHGADVSARAKEINEAYAVLGKREARAAYDRSRIRPSAHQSTAHRPFHHRKAGRRPMRPYPSMQPNGSFSHPLDTSEWLIGLFLLILTAAPIATILVLYNEESGVASTVRRNAAAHPVPELSPEAVHSSSGAKLVPGQPAS